MESYLRYQGQQLVERFDPATYVTLTRAMDTHDVSRGRGDYEEVLRSLRQPALVVSIDTDVLYWPGEQREVATLTPNARLAVIDSPHGHDAFLIDVDRLSDMVADFRGRPLAAPGGRARASPSSASSREQGVSLLVLGKGKVGAELLEQMRDAAHGARVRLRHRPAGRRRGRHAGARPSTTRASTSSAGARSSPPRRRPARWTRGARPRSSTGWRGCRARCSSTSPPTTAMEAVYEQAFRRGIHVVASNKRPLAVRYGGSSTSARRAASTTSTTTTRPRWGRACPSSARSGTSCTPATGCAAVEGSLSGTLGYLCASSRAASRSRSPCAGPWGSATPRRTRATTSPASTRRARRSSWRARWARSVALEDVRIDPFLPPELLAPGSPDELVEALRRHDEAMAAQVRALAAEGRVLRYLARIEPGPDGRVAVSVGPEEVDAAHLAARLVGVEALVAFTTARHADRPLVVQGAGVGGAITAGGVLAEIFRATGQGAR